VSNLFQNPTGQVLQDEDLKEVQDLCRDKCTLVKLPRAFLTRRSSMSSIQAIFTIADAMVKQSVQQNSLKVISDIMWNSLCRCR